MIAKQLDQITEDDLQRLIGTSEDLQSEFKESLARSDEEVKEFLKDVSAMANAIGGDIVAAELERFGELEPLDATRQRPCSVLQAEPFVNPARWPALLLMLPFQHSIARIHLRSHPDF